MVQRYLELTLAGRSICGGYRKCLPSLYCEVAAQRFMKTRICQLCCNDFIPKDEALMSNQVGYERACGVECEDKLKKEQKDFIEEHIRKGTLFR